MQLLGVIHNERDRYFLQSHFGPAGGDNNFAQAALRCAQRPALIARLLATSLEPGPALHMRRRAPKTSET
jgi:hypothetical protein